MICTLPAMTLRDYFAGQALAAVATWVDKDDFLLYVTLADEAYKAADCMLMEREFDRDKLCDDQPTQPKE
ncbi:hypothetical protein N9K75_02570 [bacterium]|nr:hypothetical protein [bacterium]